jgi:16S rRNA uridine-516 pseudouridylate synthase and related pseudouridylate synthases
MYLFRSIYVLPQRRCFSDVIRLSKRMSELNLCSRREADKLIQDSRVVVKGNRVEPILGQKVKAGETDIQIISKNGNLSRGSEISTDRGETIMLNKPKGFVSGQPDPRHNHTPAVRLLTRENIYQDNPETMDILMSGNHLSFGTRFHDDGGLPTLLNYAPAGRLDLDSSGLLIFKKNGVAAKNILNFSEKEYLVKVEPARSLSRQELKMGMKSLPYPPIWDLGCLLKGGRRLWNDRVPLKPLVEAEWVEEGTTTTENGNRQWNGAGIIRMVLQEGKKRQIRRMCRELLGLHVLELKRIRIGNIRLGNLPVGKWRPLSDVERVSLMTLNK